MLNRNVKCVIILSSKCSGSSALQNILAKLSDVSHILKTRHNENETLYWTKAASVLSMPQVDMLDSEVPINKEKAREDLICLLNENLETYTKPENDDELIFGGWELLCQKFSPVFLEKSPHHLHQWSALELIAECIERFQNINFLLIGLIRNPMDVLYSEWCRWRTFPEINQYQLLTAYRNLLKIEKRLGKKIVLIRYEDMVTNMSYLKEVFNFLEINENEVDKDYFHNKSISKWKRDNIYGFSLSEEVLEFYERLGYKRQDMENDKNQMWSIYRYLSRFINRSIIQNSKRFF